MDSPGTTDDGACPASGRRADLLKHRGWLGNNTQDYYDVLAATGRGSWHPDNDATLWVKFNLRAHHMQTQVRYAVRALDLFRWEHPYARKAFWYNERAKTTGDPQQDGYGMLRRDLTPKPVYWAFRRYFG